MLDARDLALMQATFNTNLPDTCTRIRQTAGAQDAYGTPTTTTTETQLACRFDPARTGEVPGDPQIPLADGYLYVPLGTDIALTDEIRIIARFGATLLTAQQQRYAILGPGIYGPAGMMYRLQLVNTGAK